MARSRLSSHSSRRNHPKKASTPLSATSFQRRRRELEKQNASVVADMTVMARDAEETPAPAEKSAPTRSRKAKGAAQTQV